MNFMVNCTKCLELKDESEFYLHKGKIIGRKCKKCKVKENTEYRERKFPNRRKYNTKRRKEEILEKIEDDNIRQEILTILFPNGFIPERFKKRYL